MRQKKRYARAADALKVLAHADRLRLVETIHLHPDLTVTELARRMRINQAHVSQHLQLLKSHDIVDCRRKGRCAYYRVALTPILSVLQAMDRFDQIKATYNQGEAI